jgi:hypothetical protein
VTNMEWCEQQHTALCSPLIAFLFGLILPLLCDPHLIPFLGRFPAVPSQIQRTCTSRKHRQPSINLPKPHTSKSKCSFRKRRKDGSH